MTMTGREMVRQAMVELKLLSAGSQPSADELVDGLVRLNSMLKSWATKANLWRDTDGTVTVPPATATVTLSPKPLDVGDVRIVASAGSERPLTRWEPDEYAVFPAKASIGSPVTYTLSQTVGAMRMTLWPVPPATTIINYSYQRLPVAATDNDPVDIPEMFEETAWVGLATRLAPMYGAARLEPATLQMIVARSQELEAAMLDFDRPASYQLGPDYTGGC